MPVEASGFLVGPAVFKTDVAEQLGQAGSIPVRLRHFHLISEWLAGPTFHSGGSDAPTPVLIERQEAVPDPATAVAAPTVQLLDGPPSPTLSAFTLHNRQRVENERFAAADAARPARLTETAEAQHDVNFVRRGRSSRVRIRRDRGAEAANQRPLR